jgi:hypothetical protein
MLTNRMHESLKLLDELLALPLFAEGEPVLSALTVFLLPLTFALVLHLFTHYCAVCPSSLCFCCLSPSLSFRSAFFTHYCVLSARPHCIPVDSHALVLFCIFLLTVCCLSVLTVFLLLTLVLFCPASVYSLLVPPFTFAQCLLLCSTTRRICSPPKCGTKCRCRCAFPTTGVTPSKRRRFQPCSFDLCARCVRACVCVCVSFVSAHL